MKKLLRKWSVAVTGAVAALLVASCYYDPYYTSVGGSYSSGYGDGYGYGGSNFSTSLFVSTGNPQWGYDPYCYSYYDYRRRCYYDPYLHGYYPIGYRPPVVVGCPHPYGYRRGYCPPPNVVRNVTVHNYRNRVGEYQRSNYGWARQVRPLPARPSGAVDKHPKQSYYSRPNSGQTVNSNHRTGPGSSGSAYNSLNRGNNANRQKSRTETRNQQGNRLPSNYNTPVTRSNSRQNAARGSNGYRNSGNAGKTRTEERSSRGGGGQGRQEENRNSNNKKLRGLGQG